jgi:hypothetical protein
MLLFTDDGNDRYDVADCIAEHFLDERPLALLGVAPCPRPAVPRVIGANGYCLKTLQRKHGCRICYSRRDGGFVVAAGSARRIARARRAIDEAARCASGMVSSTLPHDVRLIRGAGGERLAMVQSTFTVKIWLRPLAPLLGPGDTPELLLQRCLRASPFAVEASVTGAAGAVARAMAYYEALDVKLAHQGGSGRR